MVVLHAFSFQIAIGIRKRICMQVIRHWIYHATYLVEFFVLFSGIVLFFILRWRWITLYFRANLHDVAYIMCSIRIAKKKQTKRKKRKESSIKRSQAKENRLNRENTIRARLCCTFITAEFSQILFIALHCIERTRAKPPANESLVFGGPGSHFICCCVITFAMAV